MTSRSRVGIDADRPAVRRSAAISTARRATFRRRSTPHAPICRRRCAAIPPIASSIRQTRRSSILALTSKTLTPGQIYDLGLQHPAAEAVAGGRRGRGARSAAARCRRCASNSIRAPCSSTASAWKTCAPPLSAANAKAPKAPSSSGAQRYQVYANDTATQGGSNIGRLIIAYRNGAAVRLSDVADVTDSVENVRNMRHVQRQAGRPRDPVPAARRQYHRRWSPT